MDRPIFPNQDPFGAGVLSPLEIRVLNAELRPFLNAIHLNIVHQAITKILQARIWPSPQTGLSFRDIHGLSNIPFPTGPPVEIIEQTSAHPAVNVEEPALFFPGTEEPRTLTDLQETIVKPPTLYFPHLIF